MATLEERFWSKVDKSGDCWVWTDHKTAQGDGRIHVGPSMKRAHRIAYELAIGQIPQGMYVCHHCDNKSCVNPEHLFLGTHQDNMTDMMNKGRHVAPSGARNGARLHPESCPRGDKHGFHNHPEAWLRGEASKRAKLTAIDVLAIRSLYQSGGWTHRTLAQRFNINKGHVHRIIIREVWRHI
jgi:hypothetical protein